MYLLNNDTICAVATALGGAIAVIRISGSESIKIADSIFSKNIINESANKVIYGSIIQKENDSNVIIIDDVLLTLFRNPHSYTGEDSVEISCHASSYVTTTIIQLLIERGCRMAEPGEYTQRAFLNGKLDLSQAEAVADLISSTNESQHHIAMNHMKGGVSTILAKLREKLLNLTSLLELELDFSDHEDIEFADRTELMSIVDQVINEINHLCNSFSSGNAIKNGIPVVIIGAPNVGKSTLLNQILHDEKAIVSDIQGTTRDLIEDTINISGQTFRFIDTAGIRKTSDSIEKIGIERTFSAASKASIIILLTEPGLPYPDFTKEPNQTIIKVLNKSDKITSISNIPSCYDCKISALSGEGIEILLQQLISHIPHFCTNDVLITNLRHKQALDCALEDIMRVKQSLIANLSSDLISEDLRLCLSNIGEIIGMQITNEDVLGNIFSKFCIGK